MLRALTSRVGRRVAAAAACTPRWGIEQQHTQQRKGADLLLRRCKASNASTQPPSSVSSSIAGENTKEFLVKVPAAEMEAGLNALAEQSGIRDQLITLTSVAAAVYLGYFILPLVGGGTAGSAVQLLKSKDTLFQKTGLSRLRMIHKAGHASYMAPAIEQEGVETLLHLIVSGAGGVSSALSPDKGRMSAAPAAGAGAAGAGAGAGGNSSTAATRVREVAGEALEILMELGESEGVLGLMAAREGLTAAVRAAARSKGLDKHVRDQLAGLHVKLLGIKVIDKSLAAAGR